MSRVKNAVAASRIDHPTELPINLHFAHRRAEEERKLQEGETLDKFVSSTYALLLLDAVEKLVYRYAADVAECRMASELYRDMRTRAERDRAAERALRESAEYRAIDARWALAVVVGHGRLTKHEYKRLEVILGSTPQGWTWLADVQMWERT